MTTSVRSVSFETTLALRHKRPKDVGEHGKYDGRDIAGQDERDIRTTMASGRQRVDELQANTITRAKDAEIHGRMVRRHHLGRLALGGEPRVDADESRLDGVDVVEPVPEPDHRTRDERSAQTIAEVETRRRHGHAHLAE